MTQNDDLQNSHAIDILNNNGVAVIRTDTLYGIVARAESADAVERVFTIKGRSTVKSPIVLISSYDQLFDSISEAERTICEQYWPGKVSIILPASSAPNWIERGNNSVAYRMPEGADIRSLIDTVGPLIAPSANPQGLTPARNVAEARDYFGDAVDIYVDGGTVEDDTPSRLLNIDINGRLQRLR